MPNALPSFDRQVTAVLYDAIVVGAGPAGNMAALRLSQQGRHVAVIDWRHDIGDKLCTGIVGVECVKRFPPDGRHVIREAKGATIVSPSGRRYHIERDEPQAFVIDRVAYVGALAQKAAAAGAELILGPRVNNVEVTETAVSVSTTGDNGRASLSARLLLLTSGFGSPLVRAAGLRNGRNSDYMAGVQAEVVADGVVKQAEVYLGERVAPGSFGWLVPLDGSRALAGIISRQKLNGHMDDFLSGLRAQGRIREMTKGPSHWGVPVRPAQRTYADRVLVAGDAAGHVKPTTGGGIYYALLSGELAGETAADALRSGDLSAGRLRLYERRWKSLFGRELTIDYYARLLYESLRDEQIDRLLEEIWDSGLSDELIDPPDFSFDWHGRVILKALRHRRLGAVLRSFGPLAGPFVSRLTRARMR